MGSNELFYSDFYKPALELFNAHSALQIDVRLDWHYNIQDQPA